jgi:hypothetical protein
MSHSYEIRHSSRHKNAIPSYCHLCSKPATNEVLFNTQEFTVKQRYCDECLPKVEFDTHLKSSDYPKGTTSAVGPRISIC